jgi:hypothetical protein
VETATMSAVKAGAFPALATADPQVVVWRLPATVPSF